MSKRKGIIQSLKSNKGFMQFVARTLIFFAVLFAIQLSLMFYLRYTQFFIKYLQLGNEYYFPFLTGLRKTDFINAVLFTIIIFLLWNRKTILAFKPYKQNKNQTFFFSVISALAFVSHYVFKYFVNRDISFAEQHTFGIAIIKYAFNILFVVLLGAAVYNTNFLRESFSRFKKQIPFFALLLAGYFFVIQIFQMAWRYLGTFVARTIYFLLHLTIDSAFIRVNPNQSPLIGVGKFIVGISEECSGIDSLLLFLSLFTVILALDWYKINRKRMFLLLVPGIIFTVLYNILRVYSLILVGVYYDPQFAVDTFHTNIGWILFLLFFFVFWNFGSKWVYQKDKVSKE